MPIAKTRPPKQSVAALRRALAQLGPLKENRKRWMRIHPGMVRSTHILYPHPVYAVRLLDLLAGQTFSAILRRVAWIYYLRSPKGPLGCAEVSIVAGKHKNFRLSEGPFVRNAFRIIQTAQKDRRLRGGSFELRSIRIESLHAFILWLRASAHHEFLVPVTPIGDTGKSGQWLTRRAFAELLVNEAIRITAAHERAAQLAKEV